MGNVVGFVDCSVTRFNGENGRARIATLDPRQGVASFNEQDMATLRRWSSGLSRVAICSSEMGSFAMLHTEDAPWASWGLVRQERTILLWDCVTLTDLGRFATMEEALASLAAADADEAPEAPSNVILLAAAVAARGRRSR